MQYLSLLIPALATVIAGWLKSDQLPSWANDLIVSTLFVAAIIVYALMSGGFSGNIAGNLTVIITAAAAIFALLRPFPQQPMSTLPSPFVRRPRLVRRMSGRGN